MNKFTPDIYVKNVHNIDYKKLKEKGIKLLCFDLDNTLDKPDSITKTIDNKLVDFFKFLSKDFEVLIVSNNTINNRVPSFANLYELDYIEAMRKPFQKNYKHQTITNYNKDEVIFIGDKIITDVLGARRFGSACILVDSLFPKSNKWYSKVMHVLDAIFSIFSHVKKGNYFDNL